jgi:hypothetical protein
VPLERVSFKPRSTWILLDNQSTVDAFTNKELLTNTREVSTTMNIRCNAGVSKTNLQGDSDYGTVWYNPHGIANILSLTRVQEKHRVTYEFEGSGKFVVHKPDGNTREFERSENGLFYLDAAGSQEATKDNVTLVNTVDSNKSKFTVRAYTGAQLGRKIQATIGHPSTRTFMDIVSKNLLKKCPVTPQDIVNAEVIFGQDIWGLKGKIVRRPGISVSGTLVPVPHDIFAQYKDVTLCIDIMFRWHSW